MSLVIIGMGQIYRRDDAVGVIAVQAWQQAFPKTAENPFLRVEICPLPGLNLLELLEGADQAVIVDAIQSGAAPGTIHAIGKNDLASLPAGSGSAHGWGIAECLILADQGGLAHVPGTLHILGIEIETVELGQNLSTIVNDALLELVARLQNHVEAIVQDLETNRGIS